MKVWRFAIGQTAAVPLPVGDTPLHTRGRSKKENFHAPQRSLIQSFMPFPMEMQVKYVANPTCRCLKAGAPTPSWGQVTSVQGAVALLIQILFSLTLLKFQNNAIGSSWAPGISAYMQHLETWSIVEGAAMYSYLFVSILTSSLLLCPRKPGRFSGAGLLLRNTAPKLAWKDSEGSVAGITFDPWIPFWFVHAFWAHHCELLGHLCPRIPCDPSSPTSVSQVLVSRPFHECCLGHSCLVVPCWLSWACRTSFSQVSERAWPEFNPV